MSEGLKQELLQERTEAVHALIQVRYLMRLGSFAQHRPNCGSRFRSGRCNCGFLQAESAARKALADPSSLIEEAGTPEEGDFRLFLID